MTGPVGVTDPINPDDLRGPTGGQQIPHTKIVVFPFDQYEVVLRLSESGAVIGVEELRISKHFLKPGQIGNIDIDEFYRE